MDILPNDILIQEIGIKYLFGKDIKQLRLVSKKFNELFKSKEIKNSLTIDTLEKAKMAYEKLLALTGDRYIETGPERILTFIMCDRQFSIEDEYYDNSYELAELVNELFPTFKTFELEEIAIFWDNVLDCFFFSML